jgi:hypothetical protein
MEQLELFDDRKIKGIPQLKSVDEIKQYFEDAVAEGDVVITTVDTCWDLQVDSAQPCLVVDKGPYSSYMGVDTVTISTRFRVWAHPIVQNDLIRVQKHFKSLGYVTKIILGPFDCFAAYGEKEEDLFSESP